MNSRGAGFIVLLMIAPAAAFSAEPVTCTADEGRALYIIEGEVAGDNAFHEILPNGWDFALLPTDFGWNLRMFDAEGRDITAYTPPYRFGPNDREIYGWHFRNAENTGMNDGSVNAPQTMRTFVIAPDFAASGVDPFAVDTTDPAVREMLGEGRLTILDYGLADLEADTQARMVYLRFSSCLTWPEGA